MNDYQKDLKRRVEELAAEVSKAGIIDNVHIIIAVAVTDETGNCDATICGNGKPDVVEKMADNLKETIHQKREEKKRESNTLKKIGVV